MHVNLTRSIHESAPNEALILGAPSTIDDPLWYPDSGVTHHITNSPSFYSNKQIYEGFNNVKSGKGKGLYISHIGSGSILSSTTNTFLHLNDLLPVPKITKKILSVSKFSCDNNVFFCVSS